MMVIMIIMMIIVINDVLSVGGTDMTVIMINFIFAGRRGAGLRRLQVRVLQEVHH